MSDVEYNVGDLVHMSPGESEGRILTILDEENVIVRFDRGDYFEDEFFPVALLWHSVEEDDEEDEFDGED